MMIGYIFGVIVGSLSYFCLEKNKNLRDDDSQSARNVNKKNNNEPTIRTRTSDRAAAGN